MNDLGRIVAARCTLSPHEWEWNEVEQLEMARTIMRLGAECNAWLEIAKQNQRNTDYYRGLVVQIGTLFGKAAMTADDGTVMEDVLCAKVPELAEQREAEREALLGYIKRTVKPITAIDLPAKDQESFNIGFDAALRSVRAILTDPLLARLRGDGKQESAG